MKRREFLKIATNTVAGIVSSEVLAGCGPKKNHVKKLTEIRPNIVFVFADQWRAQAMGYAGDPNAITPNLDQLASESINFTNAVSCCPVCSPYRASLMTGQYPLTHGVFLNDVQLNCSAVSIADAYNAEGYDTAYIGKWHLDGHGRSSFVPPERRLGFKFWRGFECIHDYDKSFYYADTPTKLQWDDYDAISQSRMAQKYILEHSAGENPFALFLSWGPPHNPYDTAPEQYKNYFADPSKLQLRPNVSAEFYKQAKHDLAGYYSHIAALDHYVGDLLQTLKNCGIDENTIFVFTSDHGDMLYSHGMQRKQRPWDESVCVPFLLRYPAVLSTKEKRIPTPFNSPDIMPTLLGLSGIDIPKTVEGSDFSPVIMGHNRLSNDSGTLIACYSPFGEWPRNQGGKEYRGIRTQKYTYVRDMQGPWLLYNNEIDVYQQNNLCNSPQCRELQENLDDMLTQKLRETNDKFSSGWNYIKKWGYRVDEFCNVCSEDNVMTYW